jgi:hypothetical protein
MIYHVLQGDAQLEEFKKAGIAGEPIVFREALISGPVDADDLDTFWNERAHYILADYGEDEIEYKDKVVGEIAQLLDVGEEDEVNLWFEYELFCSVNMWFCLWLLRTTKADVYRVEPIGLDEAERWDGFAKFKSDDLKAAFELRSKFADEQRACGVSLWDAYRKKDLSKLSEVASDTHECFPYLGEVVAAATEQDIRPLEVIREIKAGGENDFGKIFIEFKKRAGVYGYGDVQVQRLLDQLSSKQSSG